ncbi:MAG: hypothetical protein COB09_11415 [Thalassobium sp.]|nr:MAG: hypothetical protein COB09_11415 [Thalassobium sp.]
MAHRILSGKWGVFIGGFRVSAAAASEMKPDSGLWPDPDECGAYAHIRIHRLLQLKGGLLACL